MDISALSARFHVNAERAVNGAFPVFEGRVKEKRVLLVSDAVTRRFAEPLLASLKASGVHAALFSLPEEEPVADEETVARVMAAGEGYDYLLAVGSGTLNDLCKRAGFLLHKESGVYATAPSMDGYTSGVTPLIEKGFKITRDAQTASDVLMDFSVLKAAPSVMIGAGVGDILAKYCCLTDWRISRDLKGEKYNEEAASLMYNAVRASNDSLPALFAGKEEGVEKLMEALLISGYAMVIAGSSRPASGAEHHMSHFLEMDFLRRGERIPLHGIKVGLGTAVSLYLYHTLGSRADFKGKDVVLKEAEGLPSSEFVLDTLGKLGCPTRFSELGVSRETVRTMFFEAYKIRDRFTILALYNEEGLMKDAAEELLEKFY